MGQRRELRRQKEPHKNIHHNRLRKLVAHRLGGGHSNCNYCKTCEPDAAIVELPVKVQPQVETAKPLSSVQLDNKGQGPGVRDMTNVVVVHTVDLA